MHWLKAFKICAASYDEWILHSRCSIKPVASYLDPRVQAKPSACNTGYDELNIIN